MSGGSVIRSACRIQGGSHELAVLKWDGGEFRVTADHVLLTQVIGQVGWIPKEARLVCAHEDQLLVAPSASANLQLATITEVSSYEITEDVIEVSMELPSDMMLAASMLAAGPFVTVFGKQPSAASLHNVPGTYADNASFQIKGGSLFGATRI